MTGDHVSLVETGRIQAVDSLVVLVLRRRHDRQSVLIRTARGPTGSGAVLHGLSHANLVAALLIGRIGIGATDRVGVDISVFNLLLHDGLWLHSLK